MTFLGLMVHNVSTRVVRSALTAFAVAIGVMTVVTLGLVTTDRTLTIEAGRLNRRRAGLVPRLACIATPSSE